METTARIASCCGFPPEAELEAILSGALAEVFPSAPRRDFRHQERFTVTPGYSGEEVGDKGGKV